MDQNFTLMAQSRANYYTAGSPVQFDLSGNTEPPAPVPAAPAPEPPAAPQEPSASDE